MAFSPGDCQPASGGWPQLSPRRYARRGRRLPYPQALLSEKGRPAAQQNTKLLPRSGSGDCPTQEFPCARFLIRGRGAEPGRRPAKCKSHDLDHCFALTRRFGEGYGGGPGYAGPQRLSSPPSQGMRLTIESCEPQIKGRGLGGEGSIPDRIQPGTGLESTEGRWLSGLRSVCPIPPGQFGGVNTSY